jgi:hypothetical protein
MPAGFPTRRHPFGLWPRIVFVLFAAACAPITQAPEVDPALTKAEADKQRQLVIERFLSDNRRLHSVAFPILAANVDLCAEKGKIAAKTGLQTVGHGVFPRDYQGAAKAVLGTERALFVAGVVPGSPAAQAGFKEGDLLLSANKVTVPDGDDAATVFAEEMNRISKAGTSIVARIRRSGSEMDITLIPIPACDYGYGIAQNSDVNAFADGRRIVFHTGMMRFANIDEELAAGSAMSWPITSWAISIPSATTLRSACWSTSCSPGLASALKVRSPTWRGRPIAKSSRPRPITSAST